MSTLRMLALMGLVFTAVFTAFGYLLFIKVVEFDHAFKLALGLSLAIMLFLTKGRGN